MKSFLLDLLGVYRRLLSPALHAIAPGGCKFHPTCSQYAAEAIEIYGAARGGWMALRRLGRCHPFSRGGFDPVPLPMTDQETPSSTALATLQTPSHDPLP